MRNEMGQLEKGYSVEIVSKGRSGEILYREGGDQMEFYWEFGGGNTVAIIWGPQPGDWDGQYPWARGRRELILKRVGEEVVNERASGCIPVYDFEKSEICIVTPL